MPGARISVLTALRNPSVEPARAACAPLPGSRLCITPIRHTRKGCYHDTDGGVIAPLLPRHPYACAHPSLRTPPLSPGSLSAIAANRDKSRRTGKPFGLGRPVTCAAAAGHGYTLSRRREVLAFWPTCPGRFRRHAAIERPRLRARRPLSSVSRRMTGPHAGAGWRSPRRPRLAASVPSTCAKDCSKPATPSSSRVCPTSPMSIPVS